MGACFSAFYPRSTPPSRTTSIYYAMLGFDRGGLGQEANVESGNIISFISGFNNIKLLKKRLGIINDQ